MKVNAEEGFEDYRRLYGLGVSLVFLKEPGINTDTYKEALSRQVPMTGGDVDLILEGETNSCFDLQKYRSVLLSNSLKKR